MNLSSSEAWELILHIKDESSAKADCEVIVLPQLPILALAKEWLSESHIQLGAQNVSDQTSGAFTGETSAILLRELGIRYCLTGHSERRELFGESDEIVAAKTQVLLANGMTPICCIGETLEEREAGSHIAKLQRQIQAIYDKVDQEKWKDLIFAYEPIWAIGTGKTASPEQANEIHEMIRTKVSEIAGDVLGNSLPILYGGSVKPGNAKDLLSQPHIDGSLVGGASLKAEDFLQIINSI